MRTAQRNSLRLLQWMMAASLTLPLAFFAITAALSYASVKDEADHEIERALNIVDVHALQLFETVESSLSELNEVVRGMSDEDIRAREQRLHLRLKQLTDSLPQMKSLWIFDRDGRTLVNSFVAPAPPQDYSDRDYFVAQRDHDAGTFVGAALMPRRPYQGPRFFGVSRRRDSNDGSFNGVIQASVLPEYFENFYAKIGRATGSFFALSRIDGVVLAQYPPLDRDAKLDPNGPITQAVLSAPYRGFMTVTWPADGIERRIGYTRVAKFPVFVSAGIETSAIRERWLAAMGQQLVFGIPATILLFLILALALHRTSRLYAEADRRRDAEEALKHSQRLQALGHLTGGVAHDFNNLLTVIRGSVDLLARPQLSEERRQRYIKTIADAVTRAATLTSRLLAFARRQTLKAEVFDVAERVKSLRDMLATLMGPAIEIIMQLPSEPCPVNADAGQFETAVFNMAVNARDAMKGRGRITFAVRTTTNIPGASTVASGQGFVALSVSDTGVGIPAEQLSQIFEPFFTTKQIGQGTGLGLSQVLGFAKQSGGEVKVDSEIHKGTTFSLYLPCMRAAAPTQRQVSDRAPASAGSGMSVLLVEDDLEVANFAADGLKEHGYTVTLVEGADNALAELTQDPDRFDVVFSDVMMPGMTGLDLARELRDHGIDVPIVLTSGDSHVLSQDSGSGFDFLQKPYSIEQLARALDKAAQPHRVKDGAAD